MNFSTRALGILVAVQLVCCLLLAIAGIIFFTAPPQSPGDAPSATTTEPPTATPTRTPTRTSTLAPTSTRVIPLPATITPTPGRGQTLTPTHARATPTPSPNLYSIVVPTPTAGPLKYLVTFDSALKVVTYTVAGKTIQELSKSLEAHAVADPREPGSDYYAQTAWNILSKWSTKIAENNCDLERADVSVQITITLPALTDVNGIASDASFDAETNHGTSQGAVFP